MQNEIYNFVKDITKNKMYVFLKCYLQIKAYSISLKLHDLTFNLYCIISYFNTFSKLEDTKC